jgi:hypothetical protein
MQYGRSNRRIAAHCHRCVKNDGESRNHSLQEKTQARRTVGESLEKSAHDILRLWSPLYRHNPQAARARDYFEGITPR